MAEIHFIVLISLMRLNISRNSLSPTLQSLFFLNGIEKEKYAASNALNKGNFNFQTIQEWFSETFLILVMAREDLPLHAFAIEWRIKFDLGKRK